MAKGDFTCRDASINLFVFFTKFKNVNGRTNKKIGVTIPTVEKIVSDIHKSGLEIHRLATVLEGEEPVGCDEVRSAADTIAWENPNIVRSDNGQMWRNLEKKVGGIDTPRTKVIYGKFVEGRDCSPIKCTEVDGMKVVGKTDFAVIALSSLTDDPIEKSSNMLLSTIGRARNSGAAFDGDKMIEYGHAPIMSEVIQAEISIRTQRTDLEVWGINSEGFYVGCLPTTYEDGCLKFKVGEKWPACYYLIVSE
jgi:hypothetical protein